ncbi:MAG: ParB N-terminal domain-containing protein [Peptoniphilus harei]|nr:ParB N-terminal domain-containing protein [Peptoniphilus harei]
MNNLQIVYKNIDELIPYENNPRNNDNAVEAVAKSIKEFGFKVPLVIDKDGEIAAGHTRLKAAKELGLEEIPCIIADDLTPEQVKAFRLADNKVAEFAQWDFNLLGLELGEIENISMEDFGFDELISGDDFGSDFSLPDNDAPLAKTITFTLSNAQYDTIINVLDDIEIHEEDCIDNNNKNGNKLYKLVSQWQEVQKTL